MSKPRPLASGELDTKRENPCKTVQPHLPSTIDSENAVNEKNPLTSEAKALANRQNALKSTGPKDTSLTRFNALKHGLTAKKLVVAPFEDPTEYEGIIEALRQDFRPQTSIEEILVQQMAACLWRRQRLMKAEKAEIASDLDSASSDFDHFEEDRANEIRKVIEEEWVKEVRVKYATSKRYRRFRERLSPEQRAFLAEIARNPPTVDYERLGKARQEIMQREATRNQRRQSRLEHALSPRFYALGIRYDSNLERQFYRALVMLLKIQAARQGRAEI